MLVMPRGETENPNPDEGLDVESRSDQFSEAFDLFDENASSFSDLDHQVISDILAIADRNYSSNPGVWDTLLMQLSATMRRLSAERQAGVDYGDGDEEAEEEDFGEGLTGGKTRSGLQKLLKD